ncbi:hypothetical protein FGO68_gene11454 [Halteria grandinella]|uniref:Uncharacterized protein n=1 Tax=Halteria grandinella TaxID=5974 RepID=A0A8J8NTN0_HALGN|nr:hypothetical protein FGO68_gene11454 [Halteria grandinella]
MVSPSTLLPLPSYLFDYYLLRHQLQRVLSKCLEQLHCFLPEFVWTKWRLQKHLHLSLAYHLPLTLIRASLQYTLSKITRYRQNHYHRQSHPETERRYSSVS